MKMHLPWHIEHTEIFGANMKRKFRQVLAHRLSFVHATWWMRGAG